MYTSPQTAKTPLFIYCAKWQRKRPSTVSVWPVQISDPKMLNFNLAEQIQTFKAEQAEKGEKLSKTEQKMIDRLEQFIANGRNLRPCMTSGYNIKYSQVEIR